MAGRLNYCSIQNSLCTFQSSNNNNPREESSHFSSKFLFFLFLEKSSFVLARVTVNLQTLLSLQLLFIPHMGSAYATIAADDIDRFQRLLGNNVIFITGTDEHGEKIAAAAAASGSSPSEHCHVISQSYNTLWKDILLMTSSSGQLTPGMKEVYSRVLANGDIYKADYEGLYCVNCEEYKIYDEKELLENHCCPIHLKPFLARKVAKYFFALSKYQKSLEET